MTSHKLIVVSTLAALSACGCNHAVPAGHAAQSAGIHAQGQADPPPVQTSTSLQPETYRGFDRNDYPGEASMQALRDSFAFTGYWLTPPPGEHTNSWVGKRAALLKQGWGFLLLANGRLDKEILKAQKTGTTPAQLGQKDAQVAVVAARSEGFPAHAIIFLDQEEGGRLLDEQAEYLLGWTEAIAASDYKPGVYASGQPVADAPGKTIDTVEHIRSMVKEQHLHDVAIYDYQDACPPAPGCTLAPRTLSEAGEPDLTIWQYAQSPRRPEITKACARTYSTDGNCYAPGFPSLNLDLDAARSADPSNGR